ncbi:MAG: AraC family transcriptional regulator [Clostridia bacterium]|nr:AraC family transcriptional regulator [Clostridia bacterium]
MNKNDIITVLSELHKITGLRVSLHGADYSEIAAFPENSLPFCARIHEIDGQKELCHGCDRQACEVALKERQTHIYKCRFGLYEAVSPLYNFGTLTGFLMMGQIAESEDDRNTAASVAARLIPKSDAVEYAKFIHTVAPDMLLSYVRIMTVCAQYLTLSNALPSVKPTVAELAKKYISENLSEKLSIKELCDTVGCSKSTLTSAFKKSYGITLVEYITDSRISRAEILLKQGDLSINEIALLVGFSDQSYFSKVFSAKHGISPSEWRLNHSQS